MPKQSIYLIGIKGVGMTALAKYYQQAGFLVEGSDNAESYVTDEILLNANIKVLSPFDKKNLKNIKPDLVVVSAAYDENNPEFKEAKTRKLKIVYYSEALGMISSGKRLIAVAGIHGKTTTTSLVALLLDKAGLSPSYIIGAANVPVLGSNGHFGDSEYFVMEADEYRKSPSSADSKFLDLNPEIAIISSIELDHPDFFGSVEDVYNAFYRFSCRVPRDGSIIINIDYPKSKKLVMSLADRKFETYGFSDEAKWKIIDLNSEDGTEFSLFHDNEKIGPFTLEMPGKHNALNAAATIIVAHLLGIDLEITKRVISEFKGVQRRFEKIAQLDGITIIDDYAHHPTAIEFTLEAVRAQYPRDKIWCIFQPHTFSRTQALLKEFGKAFKYADKVIITDIYASAREKEGVISSLDLVKEIQKNRDNVYYFNSFQKIEKYFKDFGKSPLVVVTIGAGDIYKLAKNFPRIIEERRNGKK